MFLQRVDNVFDLEWGGGVKYGEVRLQDEIDQSKYAFGQVDMPAEEFAKLHRDLFEQYYSFSERLLASGLTPGRRSSTASSVRICSTCLIRAAASASPSAPPTFSVSGGSR